MTVPTNHGFRENAGSCMPHLEKWCAELGIDVPPVPEKLGAALRRVSQHVFATRPLLWPPFCVEDWVMEKQREGVPDYLVLAHAGHGVNSYAVSYFLVLWNLRLFIQVGLGGVYMDAEKARDSVSAAFKEAGALINAAGASQGCAGLSPMLVVASEFYGSHWSAPSPSLDVEPEPVEATGVHQCLRSATAWFEAGAQQ